MTASPNSPQPSNVPPNGNGTETLSPSAESTDLSLSTEKRYAGFTATTWLQILALAVISIATVIVGGAFDRELEKFLPESKTLASTYNGKPSGLSALNEIAQKAGFSCRTWEAPYRQLNDTVSGALVVIDPVQSLQDFECDQILEWVSKGNTVIYMDEFHYQFSRQLLEKVRVTVESPENPLEEESVFFPEDEPEFEHVKKIIVSTELLVKGGREVLPHNKQGALIVEVEHGKGRIIIGTTTRLWVNRRLMKKESWSNFQLFVNLLNGTKGDILFDERCHGFTGASNVFIYLARGPVGPVVAQLLLILAVACISNWQRFGAATVIDRSRKISNLEFIFGLANAYRRAKANTTVLEIIGQGFRHKICKDAGVSPHESDEKLIEAWRAQAGDADASNLATYLAHYDMRLKQGQLSDNDLKALICSLDKISERSKEIVSKRK